MPKYSLIVTCKGRLMHLQQTLPLFCQLPDTQVILVDYGCPQKSGAWAAANFPAAKVISVSDDPGFNAPRARNIAAREAEGTYLFFADADIKVRPEALAAVDAVVTPENFVTVAAAERGDDIRGTCVVPRAKFDAVGGYDEVLKNYGMEDSELYFRLMDFGLADVTVPAAGFEPIPHGDDLRVQFFPTKSMRKLRLIASFYQEYVTVFRRALNTPQLALAERQQIHAASCALIDQLTAANDPSNGVRISMKLPRPIPEGKDGSNMEWQFEVAMSMKPKNPVAFKQSYQNPLLYKK